jgi:hypothetical protein
MAPSSVDVITQRWGVCHISGCQLSQLQDGVVVAFYHAASRHGIINDSWSQDCIRHGYLLQLRPSGEAAHKINSCVHSFLSYVLQIILTQYNWRLRRHMLDFM